ncbi:MAG: hypothetical protein ABI577_13475 [bacterium]
MDGYVDLYWLPVGAGKLSPPRKWSLWLWEALDAATHRRARKRLLHAALKLVDLAGTTFTVELMPDFLPGTVPPAMTGSVGFSAAGRWRFFRYRLSCEPVERLPDEEWAVQSPSRLGDGNLANTILALAPTAPPYVWGLRAKGTREMWTSDSAISWLLIRAGVSLDGIGPPAGGRAPGWSAGIDAAPWKATAAPAHS